MHVLVSPFGAALTSPNHAKQLPLGRLSFAENSKRLNGRLFSSRATQVDEVALVDQSLFGMNLELFELQKESWFAVF